MLQSPAQFRSDARRIALGSSIPQADRDIKLSSQYGKADTNPELS